MSDRRAALARLDALGVAYELTEHPAVFTIEDMEQLGLTGSGTVCKNLFLRDAKGRRHFLVVIPGNCRADLKSIETQLGSTRLSFASAERLQRYLGLIGGEVTPLGIINDPDAAVEVVFDRSLEGNPRVGVHPNDNTATVWLAFDDLLRIVMDNGNTVHFITLETALT